MRGGASDVSTVFFYGTTFCGGGDTSSDSVVVVPSELTSLAGKRKQPEVGNPLNSFSYSNIYIKILTD